ncbi:protein of unknown function [Rhodovastum atsumiense]|nr:DUF1127 domain-containing protein [Rhodovastum atsumiense]CAH2599678.1 protein of unknown function [Rhodovastum atsumiense]
MRGILFLDRLHLSLRRHRMARTLEELSDATLKDIGVARCEITHLAQTAWTDSGEAMALSPALHQGLVFSPFAWLRHVPFDPVGSMSFPSCWRWASVPCQRGPMAATAW